MKRKFVRTVDIMLKRLNKLINGSDAGKTPRPQSRATETLITQNATVKSRAVSDTDTNNGSVQPNALSEDETVKPIADRTDHISPIVDSPDSIRPMIDSSNGIKSIVNSLANMTPVRQDQSVVHQSLWLAELGGALRNSLYKSTPSDVILSYRGYYSNNLKRKEQPFSYAAANLSLSEVDDITKKFMAFLFGGLRNLACEFNQVIEFFPELSSLKISTTDVGQIEEQSATNSKGRARTFSYHRFRAVSLTYGLTLRGRGGFVRFFLVPADELLLLSKGESAPRHKATLRLNERYGGRVWTLDGLPTDCQEQLCLVRNLFKDLIIASFKLLSKARGNQMESLSGESSNEVLRELVLATQNMAQKIVSQQEEIQNRIARDLHDAVMAEIMMLKRSMSGDKKLKEVELVETLDKISHKISDICQDLAPRDLKDWGLPTVIEDFLERLAERSGADCTFSANQELPELPYPVQLHIYRIIQECLNNIEKYAEATKITVSFEVADKKICISISDNGRGFAVSELEAKKMQEGGTGLGGISERAAMIRCFYPTTLKIESEPGKGSRTILQIKL